MQVFEVVEIKEYPFMITKQVYSGETVSDILDEKKVYLLVDHNLTRIWTYNGYKSSIKHQIFGVKLAEKLRAKLQLKYNIYPLNRIAKKDERFKEIMEKELGGGIAEEIKGSDFLQFNDGFQAKEDTSTILDVNTKKALEYISEIAPPDDFIRKFMIVGGNIYTDEEIAEKFVNEEKIIKKPTKLGRLNRGFTAFLDNFATRLIISDMRVQGVELYIHKDQQAKAKHLKSEIPIFYEDKFSKNRPIEKLIDAFHIPDELVDEK